MRQKMMKILLGVSTMLIGIRQSSTSMAVHGNTSTTNKTIPATVSIPTKFVPTLAFFKDTTPEVINNKWEERLGEPSFSFNIGFDHSEANEKILFPVARENYHIVVSVWNNTGRRYQIKHTADALENIVHPGVTIPSDSYIVISNVGRKDPDDQDDTDGSDIGTFVKNPVRAYGSTPGVEVILYTSDDRGTSNKIELIYGISNGYNRDRSIVLPGPVDPSKLMNIGTREGSYSGNLTITVELID